MKTILLLFLTSISVLTGCTHNHIVRTKASEEYVSLNERGFRQQATVTLVNGQKQAAEKLRFDSDSTSWVDPATRNVITVPTKEIADIRFIRRGKGALQGFTFGLVGGGLTGVVLGLSSDNPIIGPEALAIIGGIYLGGLGGLIGAPVGAIVGSKEVYHTGHEYSQPVTEK